MAALRAAPPAVLDGLPVISAADPGRRWPGPAAVRRDCLPAGRGQSGHQAQRDGAKLKVYFEVVQPAAGDLAGARQAAADRLGVLRSAARELLAAGSAGRPAPSARCGR